VRSPPPGSTGRDIGADACPPAGRCDASAGGQRAASAPTPITAPMLVQTKRGAKPNPRLGATWRQPTRVSSYRLRALLHATSPRALAVSMSPSFSSVVPGKL
jgi:hypothetical protein